MVIYDGEVCMQLILDEPPEAEYNIWIAARVQYYLRLEPCEPIRDEIPDIPSPPGTRRIRFTNKESTKIWRILHRSRAHGNDAVGSNREEGRADAARGGHRAHVGAAV